MDVRKRGVEYFARVWKTDFPLAFCPVVREGESGMVLHTDGVGSKPVQAYLQWRETGSSKWFDLSQDLLAMNLDDAVCVGADSFWFVDYVALNPSLVPKGKLLATLARGFEHQLELLRNLGVSVTFLGGETADLPDQLKTFDLAGAVVGRVRLEKMVKGEIGEGEVIVGLRSGGRCRYERVENSGLMCNGITLARHCLLKPEYARRYPEIGDGSYFGRYGTNEYLDILGMSVGEAILSPTRIYTPVILRVLERVEGISALVHNTGGGLTKCLRVGKNILFVKDSLPEPDPIFLLIQREGRVSWREMYQVFNMGVGFEIYAKPSAAEEVISECEKFGVEARIIGRCERFRGKGLVIRTKRGKFCYRG